MSGHLNGVQAIIRRSYPLALYTHCASHCLNLALSKACTVPTVRNSLGAVSELINFFSRSAKRSRLLEETINALQEENEMFVTKRRRLKHLCETRWIERHESLLAVVELFPAIVRCLEDMQVDSNAPTARNAAMLLNSFKTCSIIIGLVVAQHISSILLPLTTLLQSKSIDLVDCCSEVGTMVSVLKKYRETPETSNDIFCEASVLSEMIGTEVTMPRLAGRQ